MFGLLNSGFHRKIGLNFLGYGYGQIVTTLQQFILVPLYLISWGTDLYADWLVLSSIAVTFGILDMGVTNATASRATMAASSGHWSLSKKVLHTGIVFSLFIFFCLLVMVILLVMLVDVKDFFHISKLIDRDVDYVLIGLILILGIQLVGGSLESVYRTIDRAATGYFLLANRGMVSFVLSAVALLLHCGVVQLVIIILIGQIASLGYICFRLYGILNDKSLLGFREASWAEFRVILAPSIANVGMTGAQIISLQGTMQLVNRLADSQTVVWVSMVRTLTRLVIQFGVVMNMAMRPEIARLSGEGRDSEADKVTRHLWVIVGGVSTIFYMILLLIGPDLIYWWSNHLVRVSPVMIGLIGMHAWLNVLWYVPAGNLIAKNKHIAIGIVYPIASVIGLLVWLGMKQFIKPEFGVALALGLPEIIVLILMLIVTKELFCERPGKVS